jgi:hypothetical protein
MRLKLHESPAFLKLKEQGKQSKAPISEAFGKWKNLRLALIALFGFTTGQTTLGYCGIFYVLFLMTSALKVDSLTVTMLFLVTTMFGTVTCLFMCWLSDQIGRKPVMMAALLLAALTYFPIFHTITELANPALSHSQRTIPVVVSAPPGQCSFQFNPAGNKKFIKPCDEAKAVLAQNSVSYTNAKTTAGTPVSVQVGNQVIVDGAGFAASIRQAIVQSGYATASDPGIVKIKKPSDLLQGRVLALLGLLFVLVAYAQMGQGPAAAAIVELFPTRIRLTSMSLPFQIGTGWVGGLLPAMVVAINISAGNMFSGIWYPWSVIVLNLVVGMLLLPETKNNDIVANS